MTQNDNVNPSFCEIPGKNSLKKVYTNYSWRKNQAIELTLENWNGAWKYSDLQVPQSSRSRLQTLHQVQRRDNGTVSHNDVRSACKWGRLSHACPPSPPLHFLCWTAIIIIIIIIKWVIQLRENWVWGTWYCGCGRVWLASCPADTQVSYTYTHCRKIITDTCTKRASLNGHPFLPGDAL